MKPIIRIASFLMALLTANVLYAQLHLSDADLSAIEATTPLTLDEVPSVGTFYSATNPQYPPVPANIFGLSAWNLGGGYLSIG